MSISSPGPTGPSYNKGAKPQHEQNTTRSMENLDSETLKQNLTTLLNKLDNMPKSVNLKNQDAATKTRIENLLESRISPIKDKCEEIRGQLPTSPTILNNLGTEYTNKLEGLFKQLETLVESYQQTIKEEPIIIEKDYYVDLKLLYNSSKAIASPLVAPFAVSSSVVGSSAVSFARPSNENSEKQENLNSFQNNLRTQQSNIANLKQKLEAIEEHADENDIPLDNAEMSRAEKQLDQLNDNFVEILKFVDTEVENITPEVIEQINLKIGSCKLLKTSLNKTLEDIYQGIKDAPNESSQLISDGDISMAVSMVTFSIPTLFSMSASNITTAWDELKQK